MEHCGQVPPTDLIAKKQLMRAKFLNCVRFTRPQLEFFPQSNQELVEPEQSSVRLFTLEILIKVRSQECLFIVRIRNCALPSECGELLSAAAADSLNQLRISVAGEILKGRRFA